MGLAGLVFRLLFCQIASLMSCGVVAGGPGAPGPTGDALEPEVHDGKPGHGRPGGPGPGGPGGSFFVVVGPGCRIDGESMVGGTAVVSLTEVRARDQTMPWLWACPGSLFVEVSAVLEDCQLRHGSTYELVVYVEAGEMPTGKET